MPGTIYFLANAGGLDANGQADVITSGTTATVRSSRSPWTPRARPVPVSSSR